MAGQFDAVGVAAVITALTGLVGAVTVLLAAVVKLWRRDNVTDKRVDLIWSAHVRRGRVEAKKAELIKIEHTGFEKIAQKGEAMSVFIDEIVKDEIRKAYRPILSQIENIYKSLGPNSNEGQLAEALEREYGDWLQVHICDVLGLTNYACAHLAFLLVTENKPALTAV